MKTTVDIADDLYAQAQSHARRTGRPVRALIEEGLRLALLAERRGAPPYRVPDCSVGDPEASNPLEALSWQDLRNEIYGDP